MLSAKRILNDREDANKSMTMEDIKMSIININSGANTYYGIKQNTRQFSGLTMNNKGEFSFKDKPSEGGANPVNSGEFQRNWTEQKGSHKMNYKFGHLGDVEKEVQRMEAYLKMKHENVAAKRFSTSQPGTMSYDAVALNEELKKVLSNVMNRSTLETEPEADLNEEETESRADIIVKPDGSRVLVITISNGGMETTMSLEISKPNYMENDKEIGNKNTIMQDKCDMP